MCYVDGNTLQVEGRLEDKKKESREISNRAEAAASEES